MEPGGTLVFPEGFVFNGELVQPRLVDRHGDMEIGGAMVGKGFKICIVPVDGHLVDSVLPHSQAEGEVKRERFSLVSHFGQGRSGIIKHFPFEDVEKERSSSVWIS